MAIQSNFPAVRPSLLLDFANSKRLDPRITFTRASTARFYDGITAAKAEENLLTRSQEFDNAAAYIFSRVSVTANQTTAPDGTSTADLLASTTDSGTHILQRLVEFPVVSGLTYTLSVFMKKGTGGTAPDWMQLSLDSSRFGSLQYANYDILNGTVGTIGGGATASIVSFGNGWYRCIFTATATSSANGSINITFTNNSDGAGRAPSYVDATTSDVFIWGAQVEQRSAVTAYTPTTTAPITNYVPVLQTAQAGVPRFDHNPTTGESLGLLIEESRTNLALQSEDFSTTWTNSDSSEETNVIIAPDGTLTGDRLIENTANSQHVVLQSIAKAASAITYTLSVYAKANGRNMRVRFDSGSGTNQASADFDLSAGTISSAASVAGSYTNPSASITSVGNGWYRCSVTATTGAETTVRPFILTISGVVTAYTGDGYSGVFLWGAQLEAGGFATSYIPTVAATATRQADAASMTGANFTSWFDAAEGTLYSEFNRRFADTATSGQFVMISDGSASNRMFMQYTANTNTGTFEIITNGTTQASIASAAMTIGAYHKMASAYKVNDIASSVDGATAGTDTSALIPVVNQMAIGNRGYTAASFLNGTIKKLAYYPVRLTNAQLQAITG